MKTVRLLSWLAFFAALALAPSTRAVGIIGQSFTASSTGALDSVSFTNVSFNGTTGVANVVNIFDTTGFTVGSLYGFDNAGAGFIVSSSFSTTGNVTTYLFLTGGSNVLTSGSTYYAIFDHGASFTNQADFIVGGALITGSATTSALSTGTDATGFTATITPIPEPSTYAAILGLLAIGMAGIRRRRNFCRDSAAT